MERTMHYAGNTLACARHRELMHSVTLERKVRRGSAQRANKVENLQDLRLSQLVLPKYENLAVSDEAAPLIVHLPRFERSVREKMEALTTAGSSAKAVASSSTVSGTLSGSVEHAPADLAEAASPGEVTSTPAYGTVVPVDAVITPPSGTDASEELPPSAFISQGSASRRSRGTFVLPPHRARRGGAGRS